MREIQQSDDLKWALIWTAVFIVLAVLVSFVVPAPAHASEAAANLAPTISGTPVSTGTVGVRYAFTPTTQDPEGKALTFVIQNRPSWASFSWSRGGLYGTPPKPGVWRDIIIYAKDGVHTVALPRFSITVKAPSLGSATLTWQSPTQNTDGTTLTDLAGHRIYYGNAPAALTQSIQVSSAGVSTYIVDGLAPATWYFAVKAYTSAGREGALSDVASKTIR